MLLKDETYDHDFTTVIVINFHFIFGQINVIGILPNDF